MKKKILLILMLLAVVVVMPRVYADQTLGEITYADITSRDTKESGTSSINTVGDVTTITYKSGEFKLLNGGNGRPDNKAWIGFSITLPTSGISKYTLKNEKTGNNIVTDGVVHGENDKVVNVYTGFDANDLKNATDSASNVVCTFTLTITTDSQGTVIKTIKIVIAPDGITLNNKEDNNEEWNHEKYQAEVKEVMSDIYSDLEGAISVANGIDKTKYTAESVKALEEAIADAEDFGKDLTKNNQGDVRALTKAITTAIANLVENGDTPVTPGSTTTDTNKPGEDAPNTFDAGLTYVGLALSAIGASVVSIKKLRNN